MFMTSQKKNTLKLVGKFFKPLIISYVLMLILLALLALVVRFTPLPEGAASVIVVIFSIITVIVAGFAASVYSSLRGWMAGGLAGIMYYLVIIVLGSIIFLSFPSFKNILIMLAIGFIAGAFGGIVGINSK